MIRLDFKIASPRSQGGWSVAMTGVALQRPRIVRARVEFAQHMSHRERRDAASCIDRRLCKRRR